MTTLPWTTTGVRLELPRDLDVAYAVGRMGAVIVYDLWPLFWDSPHTARTGMRRLVKLGLLRTFERRDPSHPGWYALTARGAAWVADETGSEEHEVRAVTGLSRTNLPALGVRNRFWVSLVLACRKSEGRRVDLFRPESELRRLAGSSVPIVPDALAILELDAATTVAWMIEFDAGTERLSVWETKAKKYAELHRHGSLYGAERWSVLALAPSRRRASGIANAVSHSGAGAFVFLGVGCELENGRALDTSLWRASVLAAAADAGATESLMSGERMRLIDPDRRGRSAVDRPGAEDSQAVLRPCEISSTRL